MRFEPALPLELEREIFELVAKLHPKTIPTLMCVCRRVHVWLAPFLYRVVNLHNLDLIRAIEFSLKLPSTESQTVLSHIYRWYNSPEPVEPPRAQFFRNTVRHVLCAMSDLFANANKSWQTINHFLRLHPAVFELAVRKYSAAVKTLPSSNRNQLPQELRPTRLTLELADEHSTVDLTDPLFSGVTHLTLLTLRTLTSPPNWLPSSLADLTHFCVTEDIARVILPHVFTTCPRLQAFVVFWWTLIIRYRRMPLSKSQLLAEYARPDRDRIATDERFSKVVAFEIHLGAHADARIVLVSVPFFF
ncbi:hypothetical protein MSAN_01818100 [Mycena sanguinolenta]|uniref:Uncharacterized protein n=1 Tax=Mycena sanguinolenta TaxID=230812 RepID=A0A8H7CQU6_9AGAR|nr:hypothetical protein MSAN_01818100 [Mycena sanguinolenta]